MPTGFTVLIGNFPIQASLSDSCRQVLISVAAIISLGPDNYQLESPISTLRCRSILRLACPALQPCLSCLQVSVTFRRCFGIFPRFPAKYLLLPSPVCLESPKAASGERPSDTKPSTPNREYIGSFGILQLQSQEALRRSADDIVSLCSDSCWLRL